MCAPFYYLPDLQRFSMDCLEAYGLATAFADIRGAHQLAIAEGVKGPESQGVMVCAWQPGQQSPPDMRYLPDLQTWSQLTGEKTWIGIRRDSPPKPEELMRFADHRGIPRVACPGSLVRLADGQLWDVPAIRFPTNSVLVDGASWSGQGAFSGVGTRLPIVYSSDRLGNVTRRISPTDAELWNQFEPIANWLWRVHEPEGFEDRYVSEKDQVLAACAALSKNYRLCPVTATALGLLNSETLVGLLAAAVGLTIAEDVATEKKTLEPPDSLAG